MPIYEYQCGYCSHKFEILQKINDDPLTLCPKCDESALRKLVSAVAFRLKGSGWYETDFKDKKLQKDIGAGDKKTDGETKKSEKKEPAVSGDKAANKTAVASEKVIDAKETGKSSISKAAKPMID